MREGGALAKSTFSAVRAVSDTGFAASNVFLAVAHARRPSLIASSRKIHRSGFGSLLTAKISHVTLKHQLAVVEHKACALWGFVGGGRKGRANSPAVVKSVSHASSYDSRWHVLRGQASSRLEQQMRHSNEQPLHTCDNRWPQRWRSLVDLADARICAGLLGRTGPENGDGDNRENLLVRQIGSLHCPFFRRWTHQFFVWVPSPQRNSWQIIASLP